jgi:hypothetical protein
MVTTRPGDPSPCLPTDLTDDKRASHATFPDLDRVCRDHTGSYRAVFD